MLGLTKYLERWEREDRRAKRRREKEEEREKAALEAKERKSMKKNDFLMQLRKIVLSLSQLIVQLEYGLTEPLQQNS